MRKTICVFLSAVSLVIATTRLEEEAQEAAPIEFSEQLALIGPGVTFDEELHLTENGQAAYERIKESRHKIRLVVASEIGRKWKDVTILDDIFIVSKERWGRQAFAAMFLNGMSGLERPDLSWHRATGRRLGVLPAVFGLYCVDYAAFSVCVAEVESKGLYFPYELSVANTSEHSIGMRRMNYKLKDLDSFEFGIGKSEAISKFMQGCSSLGLGKANK